MIFIVKINEKKIVFYFHINYLIFNMGKILVIVESPGKIKKIQGILGNKYIVMASIGHIIDLDPKCMSIDIEGGFIPKYKIINGKQKVVNDLKSAARNASKVLIAADEDREGEMIGWSVARELKLKKPERILFNSITKEEILKAVENPGVIDERMVDAQKGRRLLDRIVGYELSPLLKMHIGGGMLSAGRVQSVVVKLIIDKEESIEDFVNNKMSSSFKFRSVFLDKKNSKFITTMNDISGKNKDGSFKGSITKIPNKDDATTLLNLLMKSSFTLHAIFDKKSIRNPSAPFTTSTLQQDASRKLGFSVKRTMTAAQHLYEEGYITYMRTDSVNLSKEAMENIKKWVNDIYDGRYYRGKQYTGSSGTQEAHEAVRPTYINKMQVDNTGGKIGMDEEKLYYLIWRRTVASQMSPAEFTVNHIQIKINNDNNHYFSTKTENMTFDGFLTVYSYVNQDEDESDEEGNKNILLPKVGEMIRVDKICGNEEWVKPPSRFNEASLVDKLDPKNLNIGRPSTYSSIIAKIQDREYVKIIDNPGITKDASLLCWESNNSKIIESVEQVTIGKDTKKFVPTELGKLVNEFLVKHFTQIMDYKFTADMENNLDDIAEGKQKYQKVLSNFYETFHPTVVKMKNTKSTLKQDNTRELGVDPETGNMIEATIGKYGAYLRMFDSNNKLIKSGPIKPPLMLKTITLKDALIILEYPKLIGNNGTQQIFLKKGAYGYYLQSGKQRVSIEEKDIDNLTVESAITLLNTKKKNNLAEFVENGTTYTVLSGPYGNYVKVIPKEKSKKTYNASIPESIPIEKITLDVLKEQIQNHFDRKRLNSSKKK